MKRKSVFYGLIGYTGYSAVLCYYSAFDVPGWRNWQTRRTQNPVTARSCRFDSYARHQYSNQRAPGWIVRDALSLFLDTFPSVFRTVLTILAILAGLPRVGPCAGRREDFSRLTGHFPGPVQNSRLSSFDLPSRSPIQKKRDEAY
jgi:hypothetical protein